MAGAPVQQTSVVRPAPDCRKSGLVNALDCLAGKDFLLTILVGMLFFCVLAFLEIADFVGATATELMLGAGVWLTGTALETVAHELRSANAEAVTIGRIV